MKIWFLYFILAGQPILQEMPDKATCLAHESDGRMCVSFEKWVRI